MEYFLFIHVYRCVVTCWRNLAKDEGLALAIVDNFLRLMTSIELYEDPYHITVNHIAALQPLTVSFNF